MGHPFGTLHLIANPRAGNGAVAKTMPRLRRLLDDHDLDHTVAMTSRRSHASELARAALEDGVRYIAAVGGDGTVHEVINGMLEPDGKPVNPEAVLAVISAGSGGDFARTFGLDRSPEVIVRRHLTTEATMGLDAGRVTCTVDDQTRTRFFVNIAEVGWGADVVRRAERLPRFVGRVRYLISALAAVRAANPREVSLKLDKTTADINLVELVIANGQFFGGGMKVAPRALPDDGRFNVLAFTGGKAQVFMLTPKLYQGEHLPDPNIAEWQSATAELAPLEPMLVEADGEVLGHTPASFEVIDQPLTLKI